MGFVKVKDVGDMLGLPMTGLESPTPQFVEMFSEDPALITPMLLLMVSDGSDSDFAGMKQEMFVGCDPVEQRGK